MTENRNNPMQVRLPVILAATLAVGMFLGQQLPRFKQHLVYSLRPDCSAAGVNNSFDEALRYIEERYVDTIDLQEVKMQALQQLLEKLDPHSVVLPLDELEALEEDMEGEFTGIGVEFLLLEDTIHVVAPMSGGPSEAAGILAGDKIVRINDKDVAGVKIDNAQIYKLLRGEKGTEVRLHIVRGELNKELEFVVKRDIIPLNSIDVAMMLDAHTGYIKINRFSQKTSQEFDQHLTRLVETHAMKNLVLDLRGNPGGYLTEATKILSHFFADSKLLVYTKGRADKRREYKSEGRPEFNIEGLVVLVDEGSASAAEIIAGAVQDHDRGWIVGRRTYGKGLVQEQYNLSDGSGLRLTVARYFTPSGRCIQRQYKNVKDYDQDAVNRFENGELSDSSKIKIADSTTYYTAKGRIVYGGGGIMPDVYIPIDRKAFSNTYFEIKRYIVEFVARWVEKHGTGQFPSDLNTFVRETKISMSMFQELVQFAEKSGVKVHPEQLADCRTALQLQLKARLAKAIFKEEGMYAVLNDDDPAVENALKLLKSGVPITRKK